VHQFGYAVGQGALAILCREHDIETLKLVSCLTHIRTYLACAAERGLLRKLQGGCKVPITVRTTL
jgi:hydroxymethylbilane synthase